MNSESKEKKSRIMLILNITVRILIVLLSLWMIGWYLDSRLMNFGSIAGILFFGASGLGAVLYPLLKQLTVRLCRNRIGKSAVIAVGGITGIFLLWCIVSVSMMCLYADRPASENATVVVLGCQVKDGRPSQMLRLRLETAYEYLSGHPKAKCILSGGQGSNEAVSEAQCMYDYLVEKGIDPERLYKEDHSSTTNENLSFSKKLAEEKGLDPEMLIVTDWYHEFRANIIASRFGIKTGSAGGPTPHFLTASLVTREIFALANEIVFKG